LTGEFGEVSDGQSEEAPAVPTRKSLPGQTAREKRSSALIFLFFLAVPGGLGVRNDLVRDQRL